MAFLFSELKTAGAGLIEKNVVNSRGSGANLQNQGAINVGLQRFAKQLEQFVLVVSAQSELRAVFQMDRVFAVE